MALDAATVATGKRLVVLDGVFSRLMDTVTGGVVLAGLGLYLGADRVTIGVLASLPFLSQIAQVVAVPLLVSVPDRRAVVVVASTLSRAAHLLVAVLLVWPWLPLDAPLLVVIMGVSAALAVVSSAAWNWWVRDLIPRGELGRFFSRRLRITVLIGAVAQVAAGLVLDRATGLGRADGGYALLYAVGGVAGMVSVWYLMRTPHQPAAMPPPRGPVLPMLWAQIADRRNAPLLMALAFLGPAVAFALPFTAVYLLSNVGYDFVTVTILAFVSQLAYVGGLQGWGHLSDRFGHRPTLQVSFGMLVAALLGWGLTGFAAGWTLLAVFAALHFLTGFAMGGVELASANVLYKNAPEASAPAFMAAMALARSAAAGVAVLAAGALWESLSTGALVTWTPTPGIAGELDGFHVLALVSAGLGVLALLVLRRVPEEGGAPIVQVAQAMRREVHAMSSVAGIRGFVHVASHVVEFVASGAPLPWRGPPKPPRWSAVSTPATDVTKAASGAPGPTPAAVPEDPPPR